MKDLPEFHLDEHVLGQKSAPNRLSSVLQPPKADKPKADKPQKPAGGKHQRRHTAQCPYCQQSIDGPETTVLGVLGGGVRQLIAALCMFLFGLVRCVRFVVASAFCIVGFVGACFRALGIRIVHVDDRRLLDRL